MNDIEILEEYIELINKGYCDDCNELNCIDNFPHKQIAQAIENLIQRNKELEEENEDMKALFAIQANIAKELDFGTNEKMARFRDEYYVPDSMTINANIGEPKTLELRYVSATKYLNK